MEDGEEDEEKNRVAPLRPRGPVAVASFRTWRGWRVRVAGDPAELV
jgi:hypothetical protein